MPAKTPQDTFLWNAGLGAAALRRWQPATGPWWVRLSTGLERRGVSPNALAELSRSSKAACALLPKPGAWPNGERPFGGVVVGAVQSGKTQHMMALAARAFDNGYRIAIVLAGQTNDLRLQTARRFNGQLADYNEPVLGSAGLTTLGGNPGARSAPTAFCLPYTADAHEYNMLSIQLRRELTRGGSVIVVIKKHPASLAKVAEALRSALALGAGDVAALVLDDECDDASVPGTPGDTVVPDAIVSLLRTGGGRLKFAYMGYTATAAANLLQDPASPLYPQVVHLLRTPAGTETPFDYAEPNPDKWYCGASAFFERFGPAPGAGGNFVIDTSVLDGDAPSGNEVALKSAMRAYFVAGAFRLALPGGNQPFAHSMMIHTSQSMDDHRQYKAALTGMFGAVSGTDGLRLDPARLQTDLEQDEVGWKTWYVSYRESQDRVNELCPHTVPLPVLSWDQVRAKLGEAFARTKLKVVNSDDANADRLDFSPSVNPDGTARAAPDQFVIVVGGARLSRGVTIEGLATSYFAREAAIRYEDALLQMNRWFGYRGPTLEFCRIFTPAAVFAELQQMSENDSLLREQLYELMARQADPKEAAVVLRSSPYSKPTAKMGKGKEVTISFSPLVRILSRTDLRTYPKANQDAAAAFVAAVRGKAPREVRSGSGQLQGIASDGWTASEVADFLESLQYEGHNPEPHAAMHGSTHKTADAGRPRSSLFEPQFDPYLVAAYLRAWDSMPAGQRPARFTLAVSYGSEAADPPAFPFPLVNRQVTPAGQMLGGWTGRSENWPGDPFFDLPLGSPLVASKNRPPSTQGLLLLYLVHKDAQGKAKEGGKREYHAPYFGLSVPEGGPQEWRTISPGGLVLAQH